MGLNATPSAERVHIGFFGRRNAGKSSIVNAVTGQEMSVVSEIKGTTTDPVYKSMELLPMGPVVIIDTPGFDDEGSLGELRIKRTRQILNKSDCAVLVVDQTEGKTAADEELIGLFKEKKLPFLVVYNKCDLIDANRKCSTETDDAETTTGAGAAAEPCAAAEPGAAAGSGAAAEPGTAAEPGAAAEPDTATEPSICVSAKDGIRIHELKEAIARLIKTDDLTHRLVGDLLRPGDFVVLVIPIDSSAPKGRLILPQQQMIRDILEAGAISIVSRDTELKQTLNILTGKGIRPAMVITDSQAFGYVSQVVPEDITLTSFSILMARYKGFLETAVKGVAAIEQLKDGDRILISEGCTHHRQCADIGTVKIPGWLKAHTGKELLIETSSGREFPEDLSPYRLVIHCGGCMLGEREILYRQNCARDAKIPFTNYGIAIASMKGILKRSLEPFPELLKLL